MSLTRNDTVNSTWTAKTFQKLSNPSDEAIIEYWPSTMAPTATNFGHKLLPYEGVSKSDFEDGDTVYFRYIGALVSVPIVITE